MDAVVSVRLVGALIDTDRRRRAAAVPWPHLAFGLKGTARCQLSGGLTEKPVILPRKSITKQVTLPPLKIQVT